jgi:hypothetical protein
MRVVPEGRGLSQTLKARFRANYGRTASKPSVAGTDLVALQNAAV